MRLAPLVPRAYRAACPDADQLQWSVDDTFRPAMTDDQAELKIAHTVQTSGAFCSAGDAGRTL
jgi:hypothetical protein